MVGDLERPRSDCFARSHGEDFGCRHGIRATTLLGEASTCFTRATCVLRHASASSPGSILRGLSYFYGGAVKQTVRRRGYDGARRSQVGGCDFRLRLRTLLIFLKIQRQGFSVCEEPKPRPPEQQRMSALAQASAFAWQRQSVRLKS